MLPFLPWIGRAQGGAGKAALSPGTCPGHSCGHQRLKDSDQRQLPPPPRPPGIIQLCDPCWPHDPALCGPRCPGVWGQGLSPGSTSSPPPDSSREPRAMLGIHAGLTQEVSASGTELPTGPQGVPVLPACQPLRQPLFPAPALRGGRLAALCQGVSMTSLLATLAGSPAATAWGQGSAPTCPQSFPLPGPQGGCLSFGGFPVRSELEPTHALPPSPQAWPLVCWKLPDLDPGQQAANTGP